MILESRKYTKFIRTLYGNKSNVYTFCIASPENAMAKKLSDKENESRRKNLESLLRSHRLHFYPVNGKYGNLEHSYLIANINLDQCKFFFGREHFNQESFIFGIVNPKKMTTTFEYYQQDDKGKFEKRDSETKILNQSKQDDFYTEYQGFKFSIPFSIFEDAIMNLSGILEEQYGWNENYRDYLEHSALCEGYTLKHLWEYNCSHLLTKEQEEKRKNNLREEIKNLSNI